jgi:hypothetical protein
VKRFFSETTPEQRVAKLPLDLGLNNSVFAPRGDLDQPLPENQAGSSRAHRTQSAFTAEFLGLNEDHIEQDSLRPRAQSEFPPDLEAYLMSSVDDQSVLPIFTAESVFSSVAEEDRVMKEANNEATNEIEEIEEIEAWLEQFSE